MADRLEEIRTRTTEASDGPWFWRGNVDVRSLRLSRSRPGLGLCTVMDFARWGMQSARPRFTRSVDDLWMADADAMPVFEVCRDATERSDERVYRGDVVGIRHPDAEFIAHSRADVEWLLAEVDRLKGEVKHLHGEIYGTQQAEQRAAADLGEAPY